MRFRFSAVAMLVVLGMAGFAPARAGDAKEDGKALYAKKCAMCHGTDGIAKPVAKGSPNLNDPEWQKKATDEAIADVIVKGKNKMPKSAALTPPQIEAIIAHVRTLK